MNAYVFSDAALSKHAGQFVWLKINTEKKLNAAFLARVPIDAWPTLLVLDPKTETVVLKWLGSAKVSELGQLLADGAHALQPIHPGTARADLALADRAEAGGHPSEAAKLYRKALAEGGALWLDAPRVLQSLAFALDESGDLSGCIQLARERSSSLPPGGAYANLVADGLECALELPASKSRAQAVAELVPLDEAALRMPHVLADDRSSVYELLVEAAGAQGREAAKKALAGQWLSFLQSQAAQAKTPAQRVAFDPHQVEAAIALGDPARALPALQRSERELPNDYNAADREALVYLAMGKLHEALAANSRALAKVYGPRTIRVLQNRAKIFFRMKRPSEQRKALVRALAFAQKLPKSQRPQRALDHIRKQLAGSKP